MILAYVPDLMDRSKVSAALGEVSFARSASALVAGVAGASLVLVDLSRPGALDLLPALVGPGRRVVAFGSHVERTTLAAAEAAGAEVMARSEFFRRLPSLAAGGSP